MPVSIACPACDHAYSISSKALGKKVKCTCGESFVAEEYQEPEQFEEPDFEFERTSKPIEAPDTIPAQPATAKSLDVNLYAGRAMALFGFLLIGLAIVAPSTVHRDEQSTGRITIPAGDIINFPKLVTKASCGLLGMIFLTAGVVFMASGRMTIVDGIAVASVPVAALAYYLVAIVPGIVVQ